jgi:hypothetical protein
MHEYAQLIVACSPPSWAATWAVTLYVRHGLKDGCIPWISVQECASYIVIGDEEMMASRAPDVMGVDEQTEQTLLFRLHKTGKSPSRT